jgi:hypothetical protein
MTCRVTRTIQKFEREGLKNQAVRYLSKHPDSVSQMSLEELREQIVMHPDAQPHAVAKR